MEDETAAAVTQRKLRRSPRHKAHQLQTASAARLDRCARLRRDRVKTRLPTVTTVLPAQPPGYYLHHTRLDILARLSERNMWHLVDLILAHVSRAGDLCSVALVSPTWRACLAGSPVHDLRRQAYVEEKKRDRENFGQSGASIKTRSSPRLAMQVGRPISEGY